MQEGLRKEKHGDWEYSQFSGAPTVIIAETKLKWYDDEALDDLTKYLKDYGCRVFINLTDGEIQAKRRKTVRIEVYKKCSSELFSEKVADLQPIVKNLELFSKK